VNHGFREEYFRVTFEWVLRQLGSIEVSNHQLKKSLSKSLIHTVILEHQKIEYCLTVIFCDALYIMEFIRRRLKCAFVSEEVDQTEKIPDR